jgi:inner membrane protein
LQHEVSFGWLNFAVQSNFRERGNPVTGFSMLPSQGEAKIHSRSMGVKLIVVCALAILMTIPALLVFALVYERSQRAKDVMQEISADMGGQQTFLGPTLAIPYDIPRPAAEAVHGVYYVFPAQGSAAVKISAQERRRSLFKVPVFRSDLNFDASFDLADVPAAAPQGALFDWNRAEIVVGVSDPRGALADATLTADGKTYTLAPSEIAGQLSIDPYQNTRLALFGADASAIAKPGAKFSVSSVLEFSGAQRIAVLAYGKTTHVREQGDWPNPSFDGGFLPVNRSVSAHGYSAEWSVPFIARGVSAEGPGDSITGLGATSLGVSFVELVDPYQSVNRAMKYVPLFLGLVFLTYFIFEVTSRKRVHPAQYILVGVAQIIFYLLLLSLAERIGFDFGFLAAGGATVILLAANARWIFMTRTQGWRALAVFTLLYGLIYMLLRLEDNALLVGAIASFLAVAAAMYLTRKIDWYSSLPGVPAGRGEAGVVAGNTP